MADDPTHKKSKTLHSIEQRAGTAAIELSEDLFALPARSIDELGLLEVLMALSKWRDQVG